jgi:hypothetical protein
LERGFAITTPRNCPKGLPHGRDDIVVSRGVVSAVVFTEGLEGESLSRDDGVEAKVDEERHDHDAPEGGLLVGLESSEVVLPLSEAETRLGRPSWNLMFGMGSILEVVSSAC